LPIICRTDGTKRLHYSANVTEDTIDSDWNDAWFCPIQLF